MSLQKEDYMSLQKGDYTNHFRRKIIQVIIGESLYKSWQEKDYTWARLHKSSQEEK